MRYKDNQKKLNIIYAAITMINEDGFANVSMSKIAKKAGISPATIYTYFDDKNDMLIKLFLESKKNMLEKVLLNINIKSPSEKEFLKMLNNYLQAFINNKEEFFFLEQFLNSPYISKICENETKIIAKPFIDFFEKGKKELILKNIDIDLIFIYAIHPMAQIVKKHINEQKEFSQENIQQIIQMSWDSIKYNNA